MGKILGIFAILKSFWFFWEFSKTRPTKEHWAKKFFEIITPKHVQNTFGQLWERFWVCLEFWKVFDFFENFRRLDPPWNTGQKIFRKKLPQNMFKTRLDIFGNDFRLFCNFEKFLIFLKIFDNSTLQGTLGKKNFSEKLTQNMFKTHFWARLGHFWTFDFFENFRRLDPPWNTEQKNFRKNYPKTCSKQVWTLMGTILGLFGILENFWFFWKFSKTRPTMEHWAKKLSKKLPQNMFKTRLDTYGNDFGFVWNFEKFFWKFFENFRRLDPVWNTGQKNFRKNYPKTCSKHVWTLMGTILGLFGILENFRFFWKFSKTRPSMEHWAKNF